MKAIYPPHYSKTTNFYHSDIRAISHPPLSPTFRPCGHLSR